MNVQELAAALFDSDFEFDADGIIEALEKATPADLSEAVEYEHSENRSYSDKIRIPTEYCENVGEAIIRKLAEARDALGSDVFENFIGYFLPTSEVSVMGGPVWEPRILPNGALLIRNHHRIIAIDEAPSYINFNKICLAKCLSDLGELSNAFDRIKEASVVSDPILFNIIHHGDDGVEWTEIIPAALNSRGQSLVFISAYFFKELNNHKDLLSEDNLFIVPELQELASQRSRSGHAVIRIFESGLIGYGTFRASDDYDTILENHALYLGDVPDEELLGSDNISLDYNDVTKFCKDNLEMNFPLMLTENDGDTESNVATKQDLSSIFLDRYAAEKAGQILRFPAFFANDPSVAASYYGNTPAFTAALDTIDGDLLVTNVHLYPVNSIADLDNLEATLSNVVTLASKCAQHSNLEVTESYVFTTGLSPYDHKPTPTDYKLYSLGSDELARTLEKLKNTISARIELDYEDFNEAIFDIEGEFDVYVILVCREYIHPNKAHEFGLRFSGIIDDCPSVAVPRIGYYQGYDCGDLDTGNVNSFVNEEAQRAIVDLLR